MLQEHQKDDTTKKLLVRSEVQGLLKSLNRLETKLMMKLWGDILDRFEKLSQTLQKVDTSLEKEVIFWIFSHIYYFSAEMFDGYEK